MKVNPCAWARPGIVCGAGRIVKIGFFSVSHTRYRQYHYHRLKWRCSSTMGGREYGDTLITAATRLCRVICC